MYKNMIHAAVTLIAVGIGLWLVWSLKIGDWIVAEYLFDWSTGANEEVLRTRNIVWIRDGVGYSGLIYWAGGVVSALAWLFISNRMRLGDPGAHGRPRWTWYTIFIVGAAAVTGLGLFDPFGISAIMLPGMGDQLPFLLLILYVVAYWLIGSLPFTKPALLPAVPLAILVR